ncbi:DoxX family protein [Mucilaginibacter aquariorum]|uniref:DoxX family protein n=1 Tax=Mucilaginibacter aquariorum TaxID=2967225 RepID=A0ABT1SVU3_9SPHI|nr:DoxX family protein [Mucilaginibacter aquariorum]MCQ6956382.1 DoxX family protein [Mucilaginibacter aquariorum]
MDLIFMMGFVIVGYLLGFRRSNLITPQMMAFTFNSIVIATTLIKLIMAGWMLKGGGFFDFALKISYASIHISLGFVLRSFYSKNTISETLGMLTKSFRYYTIWGMSVLISGNFFFFEIGKLRHATEMEAFFRASGMSPKLHYIIMFFEISCSCGLLLHGWFRSGKLAAIGLMIIMCGAIITHLHNADPFTDSLDAIAQMIYLTIFLTLININGGKTGSVSKENQL